MMLREIFNRFRFWSEADRLGPDVPSTHWRLYFKPTMLKLCSRKFSHFGCDAEFRPGAYAIGCSKISLGARVIIRPGCMFFADPRAGGAGIVIGNDVMLGSGVHIYVHNHRFDDVSKPIIDQGHYPSSTVTVEKGAWVGASSILLPGVTVGENAVIGAGSVVTRSVPPRCVVAGNPAKIVKFLE